MNIQACAWVRVSVYCMSAFSLLFCLCDAGDRREKKKKKNNVVFQSCTVGAQTVAAVLVRLNGRMGAVPADAACACVCVY